MQILSASFTMLFIILSLSTLEAQCTDDYYGFWQNINGQYIEIFKDDNNRDNYYKPSRHTISDKKHEYRGSIKFNRSIVTISAWKKKLVKDSLFTRLHEDEIFQFRVIEIDKQCMTILPLSNNMIKIFGAGKSTLFNDFFIPITSVRFDSLHFFQHGMHKSIGINMISGRMAFKRSRYKRRGSSSDIYSAQLDSFKLQKLKTFIIQSELLKVSRCDLDDYCSCCFPLYITIYYNGRTIRYSRSDYYRDKKVRYLYNYIMLLMKKSKWKWMKKIK